MVIIPSSPLVYFFCLRFLESSILLVSNSKGGIRMDEYLLNLLHQQHKTLLDAIAITANSSSDPFKFQDLMGKLKHALNLCDVLLLQYDKEGQ